jgi:2,4-dienoyl-CoA reductase-like NADH-dependent reductase (Old Yellow Enzyme family)
MEIENTAKRKNSDESFMPKFSPQALLTTFRMGGLLLPNRVAMAPLTRQRAASGRTTVEMR